jgi:hypothetical protein
MLTLTKVSLCFLLPYSAYPLTCSPPAISRLHFFPSPFQIPNHVAIKIALELKKLLVDNSLVDVYALLESTVGSFTDQPLALLPINRRLFCRSTVGDEHLREDHEAMELESWFALRTT